MKSSNRPPDISIRLNRFIASSGFCSRRKADEYIREGAVRVNGKAVSELGTKVYPFKDAVFVSNKRIFPPKVSIYAMLNKPAKTITALSDEYERQTVADLCKNLPERVFPVDRLDWNAEGLLLMTNDGDWTQKITHPQKEIFETYLVKTNGQPAPDELAKITKGVSIIGGKAKAHHIEKVKVKGAAQYDWYKVVVTMGHNQQVRRLFHKIRFDVKKMQRISIGALKLGNLERGQYRLLNEDDMRKIFQKPKELLEKTKPDNTKPKNMQANPLRDTGRRLHK